MPIHPVLAAMLAEWKMHGWPEMMGRIPTPDDLIIPLPPEHAMRRRINPGPEGMRGKNYAGKIFREHDLPTLGLRHRRAHDLRRTFISLAQADGADGYILERCTHTPKNKCAFDGYTQFQWETLCREVAELKVTRKADGRDQVADRRGWRWEQWGDRGRNASIQKRALAPAYSRFYSRRKKAQQYCWAYKWRRRESNPGPKVCPRWYLRVYLLI